MNGKHAYSFFILFMLLAFEVPKVYYIINCHSPYHLMPQFDGPETKSKFLWLVVHYISVFSMAIFLCLRLLGYGLPLVTGAHLQNVAVIATALNSKNLGPLPTLQAIGVNITICAILTLLSQFWANPKFLLAYTVLFCLPTYFDIPVFLLYLKTSFEQYGTTGLTPGLLFQLVWVPLSACVIGFLASRHLTKQKSV
jgi:hypothetical protein